MTENDKKKCTNCMEWKTKDKFPNHKHGKDGLNPQCKECVSLKARIRYVARREREKKKPNPLSWYPSPGDKFDAYLVVEKKWNKCILGPFICQHEKSKEVVGRNEDQLFYLNKVDYVFTLI